MAGVVIGYVHPHIVEEGFARSLAQLTMRAQSNNIVGIIAASSARQHVARNAVIEQFLAGEGSWLMWIDTDMTFESDAVARLHEAALRHEVPMVAGAAFVFKRGPNTINPNAYMWNGNGFDEIEDYEPGSMFKVDATGSAFVLIHRKVFESMDKGMWHRNWMEHPETGRQMGHDLAFFRQAQQNGFELVYNTQVQTGHIKHFEVTEENWRASK